MTFFLNRLQRVLGDKLWVKPALASALSLIYALGAFYLGWALQTEPPLAVPEETLTALLTILATSMLAVATFSVSALATAAGSVATSTTPRAARLVLSDSTAQNALASFICAFIYAFLTLIALGVVTFEAWGRLALFAGLIVILAWVLTAFLRWIDHVSKLGRIDTAIQIIEGATREALDSPAGASFGARPLPLSFRVPDKSEGSTITSSKVGYVVDIDFATLQEAAEEADTEIVILVRPGSFVDTHTTLVHVRSRAGVGQWGDRQTGARQTGERQNVDIQAAFDIDRSRHHPSDPRYGFLNLSETADRALSPAINDPGTAIAILGTQLRLLTYWVERTSASAQSDVLFDRLLIAPLAAGDLIDDCFTAIARDGASMVEVGIRLQKTLQSISQLGHPGLQSAAASLSDIALEFSQAALTSDTHKSRVRTAAQSVRAAAGDVLS